MSIRVHSRKFAAKDFVFAVALALGFRSPDHPITATCPGVPWITRSSNYAFTKLAVYKIPSFAAKGFAVAVAFQITNYKS
jgi:hypothetical protein